MALENIVKNTGKGFLTGLANTVDIVGYTLSNIDYWLTGSGYAGKRALPTFTNQVYQKIYPNPDENLEFSNAYVPRFIGNTIGIAAGFTGISALYAAAGPLVALAAPAILGTYSLIGTAGEYIYSLFGGEKINNQYEKARFSTGLKLGYHETSHLNLMRWFHSLEKELTGRNLGDSHVKSSIKDNAGLMRRNIGALAGYTIGALAGFMVYSFSLGLVPLYKTSRDIFKNFIGNK